jgi:galactose mutarotase-like enzyme
MAKQDKSAPAVASSAQAGNTFEFEGKTYELKPTFKKVHVPGLGERTAQELLVDTEAQAHLVKEKCFTLIGEVIK